MPRRIELELTSERPDGIVDLAGGRAPANRGASSTAALLPSGAKVGDVLRAEAEFDIDGITVTSVLPPKGDAHEPRAPRGHRPAARVHPGHLDPRRPRRP